MLCSLGSLSLDFESDSEQLPLKTIDIFFSETPKKEPVNNREEKLVSDYES